MNICNKCGEKNNKVASFCSKCGASLKSRAPKGSNSSVIRRFTYVGVVVIFLGAILSGAYYFVDYQHQVKLETIKQQVVDGEFKDAAMMAQQLYETNFFTSLVQNDKETESLVSAIDEQRLCYLNKYPNYNGNKGIEDCVYWKRAKSLEKQEVWVSQYKEQEDFEYCQEIKRKHEINCKDMPYTGRINFSCLWNPADSDPKCNYNSFNLDKREENHNYLISQEWDDPMQQCTLERCPLSAEFNF